MKRFVDWLLSKLFPVRPLLIDRWRAVSRQGKGGKR
jgi:hypothetical protein